MIIKKIRLFPFARFADKEIFLQEGLNVFFGKNEAGKSTIFNAIDSVLFTRANINVREKRKRVEPYIPITGGDTIQIELVFNFNNREFYLLRKWGSQAEESLKINGANLVTDPDTIQETLEEALGSKKPTCQAVMMTPQSYLTETLGHLHDNPEVIRSMGDVLNAALLDTGGISINEFITRLKKEHETLCGRWDTERNMPEGGRGVNNPWRRDAGKILTAFYNREKVKLEIKKAEEWEEEMGNLNKQVAETEQDVSKLDIYIKENRKPVDDARKRQVINEKIKRINGELKNLKDISRNWPILESKKNEAPNQLKEIEDRINNLNEEEKVAKKIANGGITRDAFQRIKDIESDLEIINKEINNTVKINNNELIQIENSFNNEDSLRRQVESGNIFIEFEAKNDQTISTIIATGDREDISLVKGEKRKFTVNALTRLESDDWCIKASSEKGDETQLAEGYSEAIKERNIQCSQFGISTVEEARTANKKYSELLTRKDNCEAMIDKELRGKTREQIQLEVEELKQLPSSRDHETIIREISNEENKLDNIKSKINECKKNLDSYHEIYGSLDKLEDILLDKKAEINRLEDELNNLAPLPEGVELVEEYINEFQAKEQKLQQKRDALAAVRENRASLEGRTPEQSVEEMQCQIEDLEDTFNKLVEKDKAILRIMQVADDVTSSQGNPYDTLKKDIESYVIRVTEKSYKGIEHKNGLPVSFIRDDDRAINLDLLSTGTKDAFGLILRLAMSKYFLDGRNGFVLLDDPLVELDVERQKKVSEIIRDFSKEKQTIIFTCHKSHAETLGGNLIEL